MEKWCLLCNAAWLRGRELWVVVILIFCCILSHVMEWEFLFKVQNSKSVKWWPSISCVNDNEGTCTLQKFLLNVSKGYSESFLTAMSIFKSASYTFWSYVFTLVYAWKSLWLLLFSSSGPKDQGFEFFFSKLFINLVISFFPHFFSPR